MPDEMHGTPENPKTQTVGSGFGRLLATWIALAASLASLAAAAVALSIVNGQQGSLMIAEMKIDQLSDKLASLETKKMSKDLSVESLVFLDTDGKPKAVLACVVDEKGDGSLAIYDGNATVKASIDLLDDGSRLLLFSSDGNKSASIWAKDKGSGMASFSDEAKYAVTTDDTKCLVTASGGETASMQCMLASEDTSISRGEQAWMRMTSSAGDALLFCSDREALVEATSKAHPGVESAMKTTKDGNTSITCQVPTQGLITLAGSKKSGVDLFVMGKAKSGIALSSSADREPILVVRDENATARVVLGSSTTTVTAGPRKGTETTTPVSSIKLFNDDGSQIWSAP